MESRANVPSPIGTSRGLNVQDSTDESIRAEFGENPFTLLYIS